MNNVDTVKVTGALKVTVTDSITGAVKKYDFKNLVVTTGKNFIASRMVGNSDLPMTVMAVGSDGTPAIASNIALLSEISPRQPLTSSTALNNIATYMATFPAGQNLGELREAAIFNAAGLMLCRTTFGVVTKEATDIINIEWNITIA